MLLKNRRLSILSFFAIALLVLPCSARAQISEFSGDTTSTSLAISPEDVETDNTEQQTESGDSLIDIMRGDSPVLPSLEDDEPTLPTIEEWEDTIGNVIERDIERRLPGDVEVIAGDRDRNGVIDIVEVIDEDGNRHIYEDRDEDNIWDPSNPGLPGDPELPSDDPDSPPIIDVEDDGDPVTQDDWDELQKIVQNLVDINGDPENPELPSGDQPDPEPEPEPDPESDPGPTNPGPPPLDDPYLEIIEMALT